MAVKAKKAVKSKAAKPTNKSSKGKEIAKISKAKPSPASKPSPAIASPAKALEKITFYGHYLSIPSIKIGLMLSLTRTEHEYKHVDLRSGQQRSPQFLAINRFGQVPALVHDGEALSQSNHILQFLAGHTGKFAGKTEAQARQIKEWLLWEADFMATGLGSTRAQAVFYNADPAVLTYLRGRGNRALEVLNAALAKQPYLTGAQPSIADIACAPWIAYADEAGLPLDPYPNVQAWYKRMSALPGWKPPKDALPRP
jgi:glutathione S-transferase